MSSTKTDLDSTQVAIVGVGLRLPESDSIDAFWSKLKAGKSLISEVNEKRWSKAELYGDPKTGGDKTSSIWGGFVDDIECFDANFFGISPRESKFMDPQQRIAMEMAWHAFEDAGICPSSVKGTNTGVFMGVCHWDYAELLALNHTPIDPYFPTGTAYSILSNRISYYFDLKGPSISIDTACSSSLVSLALAVNAIKSGECELALAGGVNLIWSPQHFIAFTKNGMLSKDGKSYTFDDRANGYVRGEGGGLLLLKALDKAIEDGDNIYAVVRGIANNHGGKTGSLTVTNPQAQADLIAELYRRSNIDVRDVSYIETHGTGTPLGDPIEIHGLKKAFAQASHAVDDPQSRKNYCGIGSVKTNIGHLEGAAGVAGIIKILAALKNKELPGNLNFKSINPKIELTDTPFYIVDKHQPWASPAEGSTGRIAGISSFGFGGSNAHAVIQEFIPETAQLSARAVADNHPVFAIPVSAKSSESLVAYAQRLLAFLEDNPSDLAGIAHALQCQRDALTERVCFVVESIDELKLAIRSFIDTRAAAEHIFVGNSYDAGEGKKLRSYAEENRASLTENWMSNHDMLSLAQYWVFGVAVDWNDLYLDASLIPAKVRLPLYSFERTAYWFPKKNADVAKPKQPGTVEFTLSSKAFFLEDHTVNNQSILPGVHYLEMILSTIPRADKMINVDFSNVFWLSPFAIELSDDDVDIRKSIYLDFDSKQADANAASGPPGKGFRFYTHPKNIEGQAKDNVRVHVQGEYQPGSTVADRIDLPDMSSFKEIHRDQCYQYLQSTGIYHGPRLQGVEQIHVGVDEVWVKVSIAGSQQSFSAHPAILDSVLQAGIATALSNNASRYPYVPFSLDSLSVYQIFPTTVWARIREKNRFAGTKASLTFDLNIFTEQGEQVASAKNFTMFLLRSPVGEQMTSKNNSGSNEPSSQNLYFSKQWVVDSTDHQQPPISSTAPADRANHVLALYVGSTIQDDRWIANYRNQVSVQTSCTFQSMALSSPEAVSSAPTIEAYSHVFSYIKKLLETKPKTIQHLLVCASSTLPDVIRSSLTALLRVAHNENPRIQGRFVSIENSQLVDSGSIIARELLIADGAFSVRHDAQGLRRIERITAQPVRPFQGKIPVLNEQPVFWITGGLGGIGQLISRQLAADFPGCTLYLTGRKTAAEQQAVFSALKSEIQARGGKVDYQPLDITDVVEVENFVAALKNTHHSVDVIFHAAGHIADNFILRKEVKDSLPVLSPKLDGTLAIDQAIKRLPLGKFVLFSSVASTFGNAGQSDYAAANAFLDAFAIDRNQRVREGEGTGQTIAINWPLWQEGGMKMDAGTLASVHETTGMEPLPTHEAMHALRYALTTTDDSPILVTYGNQEKIHAYIAGLNQRSVVPEGGSQESPDPSKSGDDVDNEALFQYAQDYLKGKLAIVIERDAKTIRGDQKIEEYGFDSIMAVEMIRQLEGQFGQLSKTLFFEYFTINEVADYLMDEYSEKLKSLYLEGRAPVVEVAAHTDTPSKDKQVAEEAAAAPAPSINKQIEAVPVASQVAADDRDQHDIAIIGLSGRYPKSRNMDELWELLKSGQHAFEKIPADRWKHDAIYYKERDVWGKSTIKTGGFLDDIDKFDPRYFQISQLEAEKMSPEVRLFLEVGVEALEDSGYSKESLQQLYKGDVGVVAGTMSNHYNLYGFQNNLTRGGSASGSYTGTIPNMLSYFYGFTGPSLFVDTMCSATSTCIHVAVQMLRSGESKIVVAGGMNLLLHPYNLISSSQEHFTTKTSDVIRSYGIGADGTILGEGVGAVVLKTLADAKRDGDNIWGIIKGTALSNAGVRNGFTVPQPHMQALAIEKAIEDAQIDPQTIGYFEGHGSGTELGDPVEIKGATQAFRKYTDKKQFCPIGSIKSNVAHLLAAAGIAGISKILLQFKHQQIVPSLGADTLNSNIRFEDSPFYVHKELQSWPAPRSESNLVLPRRASITSIGAGGMNSHMILEEYVDPRTTSRSPRQTQQQLFVFSATNRDSLVRNLQGFSSYLKDHRDVSPVSLAYTLQVAKNQMKCRLAFCADSVNEVIGSIDSWLGGLSSNRSVRFVDSASGATKEFSRRELSQAIESAELETLAEYWTNGSTVDWFALHGLNDQAALGAMIKVRIPAYQFEKKRCWFEVLEDAPSVIDPLGNRNKYHPLVRDNTSDLSGIRYSADLIEIEILDYLYRVKKQPQLITFSLLDAAIAVMKQADPQSGYTSVRWELLAPTPVVPSQLCYAVALNDQTGQFSDVYISSTADASTPHQLCARVEFAVQAGDGRRVLQQPFPAFANATVRESLSGAQVSKALEEHKIVFGDYVSAISELQLIGEQRYRVHLKDTDYRHNHFARNTTFLSEIGSALQQAVLYIALRQGLDHWSDYALCACNVQLDLASVSKVSSLLFSLESSGQALRGTIALADKNGTLLSLLDDVYLANSQAIEPRAAKTIETASFRSQPVFRHETAESPRPVAAAGTESDGLGKAVSAIVAKLLKFDESEVDARTSFYEFGFDSIGLTQLSKEVNETLGARITPAVFFDCENIEALCFYLKDQGVSGTSEEAPQNSASAVNQAATPVSRVEKPEAERNHRLPDPHESIAVIGMAGRFPGAASVEALWSNLLNNQDSIQDFPYQRYNQDTQAAFAGVACVKKGGYLDKVDGFDAAFFNISRVEAEFMDPQQRQVLEVVWHAVENAAYDPSQLPSDTGVFIGVSNNDYRALLQKDQELDGYIATGNSHAMLANRVSFFLDIHGPSESIDTACSSSLVAIHNACESLRSGSASFAIAGGVNLLLDIQGFAEPDHAGMLSLDGRCNTFSRNANGYVRGEGVGVVILKPLSLAQKDGDNILAVIESSAHQHGGRAKSLTAPNAKSQAELLRTTLKKIDLSQLQYVEAHGTGTELGDPVEVNALKQAVTETHGLPIYLGALKSNIGHLESAAGVAGLIKAVKVLSERTVPANLHCSPLNPYIELHDSRFVINERQSSLKASDQGIFAAVSSFGFGGSIASVVLRRYESNRTTARAHRAFSGHEVVLVLSAKTRRGLVSQAINLRQHLSSHPEQIEEVAYTLQVGRAELSYRLSIVAMDSADGLNKLTRFIESEAALSDADFSTGANELNHVSIFTGHIKGSKTEKMSNEALPELLTLDNANRVAERFVKGVKFNWNLLYGGARPNRVVLPGYPFEQQRYWLPKDQVTTWYDVDNFSNEQFVEHSFYENLLDRVLVDDLDTETVLQLLRKD
ncbi:SDR family NAD(P)-dependent oxidoreductase [Pseudomonas syringae]|uniref:SDR family NAD(P)-dependent oxidoreductase n=1 Tax=Pseudomonas syringae TaxID=317 RepID=UPI000CD09BEC|nr:SDR family NAD(P)-dependent oxidoreductase [Pseudomonas syringae]